MGGLSRLRRDQAEKQPKRKDAHRKTLLPNLRVADVGCWPTIRLVYISNIEHFVKLKSCLSILFKSQGTTAVWDFNFLSVGF